MPRRPRRECRGLQARTSNEVLVFWRWRWIPPSQQDLRQVNRGRNCAMVRTTRASDQDLSIEERKRYLRSMLYVCFPVLTSYVNPLVEAAWYDLGGALPPLVP